MKLDIRYAVVQAPVLGTDFREPIVIYTENISSAIETMTCLRFINRKRGAYLLTTIYNKEKLEIVCGYPGEVEY